MPFSKDLLIGASGNQGGAFPFDFQIEQSARFTRSENSYLTGYANNFGTGNRNTWSMSFWIKLTGVAGVTDSQYYILTSDTNSQGSYDTIIMHVENGKPYLQFMGGEVTFDAVMTDTSAWYHMLIVADSTNATATLRKRLYVNGTQISPKSASYPSQNADSQINWGTKTHYIGRRQDNNSSYHGDYYLAEMHFVDGQAYGPEYFGESKDAPGGGSIWVPIDYKTNTGTYGTTGYYLTFSNASSLGADTSGNSNNWSVNNMGTDHQMADSPTFDDAGS